MCRHRLGQEREDRGVAAVSTLRDAGAAQGGHIGFAAAGSDFTATQPGGGPLYGTRDLFRPYDFYTGEGSNFADFQAGYNVLYKSGLLLGFEADISFAGNTSGASGGA